MCICIFCNSLKEDMLWKKNSPQLHTPQPQQHQPHPQHTGAARPYWGAASVGPAGNGAGARNKPEKPLPGQWT